MNNKQISVFISLYYSVWLSCIFLAKRQLPYLAIFISIIVSLVQLSFFISQDKLKKLTIWVVFFSCLGFATDSLFLFFNIISFKANPWQQALAPPWILALWINFSVTSYGISAFLLRYTRYMPIAGLIGFPAAYYAGMSFSVASSADAVLYLITLGLVWCLLFPVSLKVLKNLS